MFSISSPNTIKFERHLQTFAAKAAPFAVRETLNSAAFEARTLAQGNLREQMILKNKFSEMSVRVNRARGLDIHRMISTVGSVADYLERQEFGFTEAKKGRIGKPITTSYAAGQGRDTNPRTRLATKRNAMRNINTARRMIRGGGSRKQLNAAAVRKASVSANKYTFLDLDQRKGIFRILGVGKRIKVQMVQDLSSESITVKRNPWLAPAHAAATANIPAHYHRALEFQLRRQGLFT